MASTRRARGSRSRAIFAAGLLAAAAITTIPAGAATAPVLVASTVDNGWSNGRAIVVQYDQDIRGCTGITVCETVTVTNADGTALTDAEGQPINGILSSATSDSFLDHDQIVWQPDLEDRRDANGQQLRALPQDDYVMTVSATGRIGGLTSTTSTLPFKVDNLAPSTLRITSPTLTNPDPAVALINGVVSDHAKSQEFRSGIRSVVLHFYNATDPFSYDDVDVPTGDPAVGSIPTKQPTEIRSLRRFASLAPCDLNTPACVGQDFAGNDIVVQEKTFEAEIDDLGPGLWTIKAIAIDNAGNQSGEVSTTFLKIA